MQSRPYTDRGQRAGSTGPTSTIRTFMPLSETARISRRGVLRTIVNVGVGAGLVWGGGADYATSGDTTQIEYALVRPPGQGGSLSTRRKTVPADWYSSVKKAFDVQKTLRESALSSLVGAFVVPGSFDEPAASISLDATTESVGEEATEITDDLEFDVNVLDEFPPKPDDPSIQGEPYQISDFDQRWIPGGIQCASSKMSGTLAPSVYDPQRGRRYFLTSNHVYGASGTKVTEHRNAPLYLQIGHEKRIIGRVERGYPEADFVRVSPIDGYVPVPEVARVVPSTVIGQYTRMGLADLMARGQDLHKFGALSGHTQGRIHGVDGFTCYIGEVCKPGQLKWGDERTITDGDSGSINYTPDPEHPEEYLIAGGINNARSWWPGADFTWGTAAYRLLDAYGLHFSPSKCTAYEKALIA